MYQNHSHTVIDYRNARYQGIVNTSGNRHGLGVMVDDDLSFYVSQWNNNLLNGQTLVYISHGKYIYGRWQDNEPHGINVFRTGQTVLVGYFQNGRIINKVLVIFQKYNIIAVLETLPQKQQFEVISCGKLLTHDDLTQYIQMLDIKMPDNYFSLIKFVTSLTERDHNQTASQSLIASPCQGENCYFGYRDGLAIVFNSNNGVVSVGQHENKKVSGFGGKFDGKKIQQGNFQLQQTITYQKKRPNNQIYTIFQKLHKRSLNFKNQYFDSKVKTLGDLQSLLRGNIQKIVNFNMKNGLGNATAGELNDSLDYQIMDEYQSVKAAENRQAMYEKQSIVNMKKTASSNYQEQKSVGKTYTKSPIRQAISQKQTRRQSQNIPYAFEHEQNENYEQTQRKTTPRKDSTRYYPKKSPIRFKQQDKSLYNKQSKIYQRENIKYGQQIEQKIQIPDQQKQNQFKAIQRTYSRVSTHSQHRKEQNRSRSPINYTKNIEENSTPYNREILDKVPKFGGLQLQEDQRVHHNKSTFQNQVQEYKKVLEKSRSRQKLSGHSLSKYLKRPNYEDIEQRRKRLLGQFKQLNQNESVPHSQVSKFSDARRTPQRGSIQIDISGASSKSTHKEPLQSPCMKEKILSFTSENDIPTENSQQGYLPLSLINNDRSIRNRNQINNKQNDQIIIQNAMFGKKQSTIDRLEFTNGGKIGKQNIQYTPGSFVKYKKNFDDIKVEVLPSQKKNDARKFYCKDTERTMELLNITRKPLSQNILTEHQQEEDNRFSEIQLKPSEARREGNLNFADNLKDVTSRQGISRNKLSVTRSRDILSYKQRDYTEQRESTIKQRDSIPQAHDLSRKRKGYQYYFDG